MSIENLASQFFLFYEAFKLAEIVLNSLIL